ncbi:hypothetical protein BHE74_00028610 [Ensete ventricosum]|nr:hypothetical protein BHE74_00028610 [Ensete ventricosum]RZS06429.1 hypothetical protein BHM03_00037072 [Ensete ventricosum]
MWLQRKWALVATRDRYYRGYGGQGKRCDAGAAGKGGRWQRLRVGICPVLITGRKEGCYPVFVATWGEGAVGSRESGAGRQQRRHKKRRKATAVSPVKVQEMAATGKGNASGRGSSADDKWQREIAAVEADVAMLAVVEEEKGDGGSGKSDCGIAAGSSTTGEERDRSGRWLRGCR